MRPQSPGGYSIAWAILSPLKWFVKHKKILDNLIHRFSYGMKRKSCFGETARTLHAFFIFKIPLLNLPQQRIEGTHVKAPRRCSKGLVVFSLLVPRRGDGSRYK